MRELIEELVIHCVDLRRQLAAELKDVHRAADITQSSFERVYLQAIKAGQGLRPGASLAEQKLAACIESPRALLFRVARNLCIDEARHHQVAREWRLHHAGVEMQTVAPSCEYTHAQRQVLTRVIEIIEQLPPLRRQVFLMFRAHGFTRAEIARHLDMTEMAVAKHMVRATVDCAKVFAELRSQLIEPQALSGRTGTRPVLAEDLP